MAYQVPKSNHPWRQYQNKPEEKEENKVKKSVKTFICEIAESYENIEIYANSYGKEDRFHLPDLPQSKQASWIVGMLKKYYRQF